MEIKNQKNLKLELLNMAPHFTNSVLVSHGNKCIIFDAWGRAQDWIRLLHERNLELLAIYSTHGHPDHISAAPDLVLSTGAKWFLNNADFNLIGWGDELLNEFGLPPITRDIVPTAMPEHKTTIFNDINMDIISCPGHTCGGVAFYIRDLGTCIVGDTIFADSIGRTDLPGGDTQTLKKSILHLYEQNMPDDTIIIPGHDNITNIATLKKHNPYFKLAIKSRGR